MIQLISIVLVMATAHADDTKVRVDSNTSDQDTSIVIHKGAQDNSLLSPPDYQIVENAETISGEPVAGRQESYQSWKKACDAWKKELKDQHGARLISANCGKPQMESDPTTFMKTQSSAASYKVKVAIRETKGSQPTSPPAAAPAPSVSSSPK